MYASRTTQFVVGIFALLGILALGILSLRLGELSLFPPPSYVLYANFDDIAGLKTGDNVELAGVKIGKVIHIALQNQLAHVAMRINIGVKVDNDAIAGIKTNGLLGDKFVMIQLGGGEKDLGPGDYIRQTQSAFVLEDVIGQFINNSGSGSGGNNQNKGGGGGAANEIGPPPGLNSAGPGSSPKPGKK